MMTCADIEILSRPLELTKVAELKYVLAGVLALTYLTFCRALLPELIRFAYIPSIELRIHADSTMSKDREASPDFLISTPGPSKEQTILPSDDDEEHVLVLDFTDAPKGQKNPNPG